MYGRLFEKIISRSKPFKAIHNFRKSLTFHDGGRYHIETSPLICAADQWTGFYMLTASVMKGLILDVGRVLNTPIVLHYQSSNNYSR